MSKDNANPIVYAQSSLQTRQRTNGARSDEWWRDSVLSEYGGSDGTQQMGKKWLGGDITGAGKSSRGLGSDSGYDDDEYDGIDDGKEQDGALCDDHVMRDLGGHGALGEMEVREGIDKEEVYGAYMSSFCSTRTMHGLS